MKTETNEVKTDLEVLQKSIERKIIELAVASGRLYQSSKTHFVHVPIDITGGSTGITESIALHDNILFVLALLRLKTQESIQEAKVLLDRILYFQQRDQKLENYGNFPVYLHDYPYCYDHFQAAKMLPALFWIHKEFAAVLGGELAKRLLQAKEELHIFLTALGERLTLPHSAKLALDYEEPPFEELHPALIGDVIVSAQMHNKAPSMQFLQYLAATWHQDSKSYIAIAQKMYQAGFVPACTLYDYVFGAFSGSLSARAAKPQIVALQAALLQPISYELPQVMEYVGNDFFIHKEKEWAFSVASGTRYEKIAAFFPFYFVTCTHTFVLDIPHGYLQKWQWQEDKSRLELFLALNSEIYSDNIEKAVVCSFFVDDTANVKGKTASGKATAFDFSQAVNLSIHNVNIDIAFEQIEGDAMLMNHLNKGNRPWQQQHKEKERFHIYDLQLFVRAVRGTTALLLKATLTFNRHE